MTRTDRRTDKTLPRLSRVVQMRLDDDTYDELARESHTSGDNSMSVTARRLIRKGLGLPESGIALPASVERELRDKVDLERLDNPGGGAA